MAGLAGALLPREIELRSYCPGSKHTRNSCQAATLTARCLVPMNVPVVGGSEGVSTDQSSPRSRPPTGGCTDTISPPADLARHSPQTIAYLHGHSMGDPCQYQEGGSGRQWVGGRVECGWRMG